MSANFGHLEGDITAVADGLRADLQAIGEWPLFQHCGHRREHADWVLTLEHDAIELGRHCAIHGIEGLRRWPLIDWECSDSRAPSLCAPGARSP